MSPHALTVLALKVALAPLLVTLATLAGRRWGAVVAGAVTALPIVAGPILAIIAIEHGREFGDAAARSALLGVVALAASCVAFARAANHGWPATIAALARLRRRRGGPLGGGRAARRGPRARAGGAARGGDAARSAARPSAAVAAAELGPAGAGGAHRGARADADRARRRPGSRGERRADAVPRRDSVMVAFVLAQDGPAALRNLLHGFVRALPGIALSFLVAAIAL